MKIHTVAIILTISIIVITVMSGCIEDTSVDSPIDGLSSENSSIASSAIDYLVENGDEYTIQALIQVIENKNETIGKRENAIVVLGRIGDNKTADLLLNISMNEEEEKTLRRASILALGDIGNKTAIESLRKLGYGDDGLILYHAAYVLDKLEENPEVFGTYGELPYPLSEEHRLYRNNVREISIAHRSEKDNYSFPNIENATSILVGYSTKSGYIEISSNVKPEASAMDEIYQVYDSEAKKRGISKVPVRFVYGNVSFCQGYFCSLENATNDFDLSS
ncbi:HEAT repeat domain-containing protein [Methanolobus sp. ZRKC2]|uniref:HEAT repeat domain-containing protein n=1 Tax=Methanolobus sp. ZRKC2 TaxID=3125783 RepID=UPI00324E01C6